MFIVWKVYASLSATPPNPSVPFPFNYNGRGTHTFVPTTVTNIFFLFMAYLRTLSEDQTGITGCLMNKKLERIWKEAVVAWFKVLSLNSPEELRNTMKNVSQNRRYMGRDLKFGPPEYETGALTNRPRSTMQQDERRRKGKWKKETVLWVKYIFFV
jgi:hypothetical protein